MINYKEFATINETLRSSDVFKAHFEDRKVVETALTSFNENRHSIDFSRYDDDHLNRALWEICFLNSYGYVAGTAGEWELVEIFRTEENKKNFDCLSGAFLASVCTLCLHQDVTDDVHKMACDCVRNTLAGHGEYISIIHDAVFEIIDNIDKLDDEYVGKFNANVLNAIIAK